MADIYLEQALKSLAEDEERLGRLISSIEADRSKDRAAKLPKEKPKFEPATKESADYVARNLTADANKNLNRIFGGLNGGQVQKEIARRITGPIEYKHFAADVILHILCEAVPYLGGRGDNATRAGLRLAVEELIKGTNANGLARALDAVNTATTFAAAGLTTPILTQTGISLGSTPPTNFANPIEKLVFQLLLPYNIEYIRFIDAKTQRIRAADADMKAFIANQAVQRAVILSLRSIPASDKVLMPNEIGGYTASLVGDALVKFPAKDLDDTYNYYKKAYDNLASKGGSIARESVQPFIDAAIKQLEIVKREISGFPFSRKAKSKFEKAIDIISGREILSATGGELDDESKLQLAYLSIAELVGAVSATPALDAPFPTTPGAGTIAASVNAELAALGTDYQSSFPSSELSVEESDLQAAIKPSALGSINYDPMYGKAKTALANAVQLLTSAYPMATSVSALGIISGSLAAPTAAARVAPTVTAEFKEAVQKALIDVVTLVKNFVNRLASTSGKDVFNDILIKYLQTLTGDQGLALTDFATGYNFPNVPESFYLALASSEGVNALADGAGGIDALKKSLLRLAQSQVATAARTAPVFMADRRVLPVLLEETFEQIDDYLDGTVEQLRYSGMKLRQNPSDWYNPATTGGRVAGVVGGLYGTHALTAVVNSVAKPKAGSMAAHAVNFLPTLAVAGVGGGLAYKHDKQGAMISAVGGGLAHLVLRTVGKVPAVRFGSGALAKGFQYVVNGPAYLVGDDSMGYCSALPFSVSTADAAGIAQIIKACRMNDSVSAAVLGMQAAMRGLKIEPISDTQQNIKISIEPAGGPDFVKIAAMPATNEAEKASKAAAYITGLKLVMDAAMSFCQLSHLINVSGVEYGAEGKPTAAFAKDKLLSKEACDANQLAAVKLCPMVEVAVGELKALPAPAPAPAPASTTAPAAPADPAAANTPASNGYRSLGNYIQMPGYSVTGVYQDEDTMEYLRPSPKESADPGIKQLNATLERARVLTPSQLVHEGYADLRDTTVLFVDPRVAQRAHSCGLGTDLGQSRMNPGANLFALDVESDVGTTPIYDADNFDVPQGKISHKRVIGPGKTEVVTPTGGSFGGGVFKPRF